MEPKPIKTARAKCPGLLIPTQSTGRTDSHRPLHSLLPTHAGDQPVTAPVPCRQTEHVLFDQQTRRYNGRGSEFPFRAPEVDHVIPRGGQDNIENLQLLCAHCNRIKGDRSQACLVARLRELGIAARQKNSLTTSKDANV